MARPRSEEARRKALAAATDLIVERGVANLTIEEVAARSGVAKTTIYRHWPERASLIIDTVRATFEHVGTPDTGSLRGDLEAYFGGMVRADLSGKVGQLMPCLIDAAARDPEIELLLDRIGVERQQPILAIVERAQERGELPDRPRPARRRRHDRRTDRVPQAGVAPAARRGLPRGLPRRRHRRPGGTAPRPPVVADGCRLDAVSRRADGVDCESADASPPSAARSGGSTRRRTPSAACG